MSFFSEIKIIDKLTRTAAKVNSDGQFDVINSSKISTSNSSSTPLDASAQFVGTAEDVSNFSHVTLYAIADQASASEGLIIEQSSDGINWDKQDKFTLAADTILSKTIKVVAKYLRVSLLNGASAQTELRLQVILKQFGESGIVVNESVPVTSAATLDVNVTNVFVPVNLNSLDSTISENAGTQLKVTPKQADGTPGNLITAVDYVVGKSGIDAMSETLISIPIISSGINNGFHFGLADYQAGVANADKIDFVFTTPTAPKLTHLWYKFSASDGATIELFEAPTVSGGTTITPGNSNLNSANVAATSIVKNPTVTATGTRMAGYVAGGDKEAGLASIEDKLILKPVTKYLIRITSLASGNFLGWQFNFCEHTPLN